MTAIAKHVTFQPLTASDLPVLHAWLQRPHVAEWWGHPHTLQAVEAEYLPVVRGQSTTRAYTAWLNGQAVGFIQSYVVLGSGDGWWEQETDPGARGIDQFLCNANQLNQGLGTAMVACFCNTLLADPAVTQVQADPSPGNLRAVRCYQRAGFQPVGEVTTPDGLAMLMVKTRASLANTVPFNAAIR